MRRTIALLVLAGLTLSAYLLTRHFALIGGAADRSVCSTVLHLDCDEALSSPTSAIAGLPLAAWGVVWFGTLGMLLLLGEGLGDPLRAIGLRAALALALVAALAGAALVVMMATGASPFCPLCAAIHAIDFALVPVLVRASGRPVRALGREIRAAVVFAVRPPRPVDPSMRAALAGLLCAALAALVTVQAVFTLEVQHKPLPPEAALKIAVANYAMSARLEFPADDRDVRFGAADAPTQLVVFSDFECAGCRAFAKRLAKLVNGSKGKISAVFKHFPVDPECNRNIKESHHPHACAAARAAEAARLQGRFTEFHDALFAETVPLTDDVVARVAKATGLDAARFDADRATEDARKKIADDIELGIRLNVQETPTVFLNGRKVPDISPGAFGLIMMSQANDKPISLTKKLTPVADDDPAPEAGEDAAHKPAEDH